MVSAENYIYNTCVERYDYDFGTFISAAMFFG